MLADCSLSYRAFDLREQGQPPESPDDGREHYQALGAVFLFLPIPAQPSPARAFNTKDWRHP
jgi:hypothetical protein